MACLTVLAPRNHHLLSYEWVALRPPLGAHSRPPQKEGMGTVDPEENVRDVFDFLHKVGLEVPIFRCNPPSENMTDAPAGCLQGCRSHIHQLPRLLHDLLVMDLEVAGRWMPEIESFHAAGATQYNSMAWDSTHVSLHHITLLLRLGFTANVLNGGRNDRCSC